MSLAQFVFVSVVLGPLHNVFGDNYKFEPNCVPACTSTSAPLTDMKPCMCRPDFIPAGCQLAPCGPGEVANEDYTCQCTEYFKPNQCVTLFCDNGTTTYGTSCPPNSYSTPNYPSTSYLTQSYVPAYYPSPSYPSSNYPSLNYPSLQYGYHQPSYNPYSSSNLCNKYCICEPYLPADCTDDGIDPIIGGPACTCKLGSWRTGCTVRPCQSNGDQYCECTPTFQPSTCFTPRCSSS